jgi:hypothetical protein
MREASPELERFVDESIQLSRSKGYHPTVFEDMRARHRTWEAMRRIVQTGDIQSGFRRLVQLGLRDWTVEAGIVKFATEFDKGTVEAARWRLEQASTNA